MKFRRRQLPLKISIVQNLYIAISILYEAPKGSKEASCRQFNLHFPRVGGTPEFQNYLRDSAYCSRLIEN